jgi:hypothetical protein
MSADSEEKHEPVSDIDTAAALDCRGIGRLLCRQGQRWANQKLTGLFRGWAGTANSTAKFLTGDEAGIRDFVIR